MDSNWIEVYGARRSIKPHLEVVFSGSEIELKAKTRKRKTMTLASAVLSISRGASMC